MKNDSTEYKNRTAVILLAVVSLATHMFFAFKNSQGMFRYIFGKFTAETGGMIKDRPIMNYITLAQGVLLSAACLLWILYVTGLYNKEKSNMIATAVFSMFALGGTANVAVNAYSFAAWLFGDEISYAKLGYMTNAIEYGSTPSSTAETVGKILIYSSCGFVIMLIFACIKLALSVKKNEPTAKTASVLFEVSSIYMAYLAIAFIFSSCVPYINGYDPCGADIFWNFVAILASLIASALQLIAISLSVKLFYKSTETVHN